LPNTKGVLDYGMEGVAIELQHINVKLLVIEPAKVDLGAVIPIFHQWIQDQIFDELLLDVANYSHVPEGPGVVLIGHEADYALDNTDGRLGVRYNRKAILTGSNRDRLVQATRSALKAFLRLEQDLKVYFNKREMEIVVNDRWLAPNSEQTAKLAKPELEEFLRQLLQGGGYAAHYRTEPRKLFGVTIIPEREFSLQELSANLSQAR